MSSQISTFSSRKHMQPVFRQRSSWFGHLPRAHCRSVVWWGESAFYPISWTENKCRFLAHLPSALCRASWSRPIFSTATTEPTKSSFPTPLTTWRWRTSWLLSPICSSVSFGLWKGSWNGVKKKTMRMVLFPKSTVWWGWFFKVGHGIQT